MFVTISWAHVCGQVLLGAPLGSAPALVANIRLGWKELTVMNTLIYFNAELILGPMLKTFYIRNLRVFVISLSVCPWKDFPAEFDVRGLRFLPRQGEHFSGAILLGRLLILPENIRLGRRGLLRTNTLAYYKNS